MTFSENVPKAASHEPEPSLAPDAMFAPAANAQSGLGLREVALERDADESAFAFEYQGRDEATPSLA